MNAYEQMRNTFLAELSRAIPAAGRETLEAACGALDRAVARYDITTKETALAVETDPIPGIVKTYIVVKRRRDCRPGRCRTTA